ncbi:MAG: hypothetical protein P0116_06445 [Candidatus Nitrosocosmicus sp.]|nr:hypothetical protein [Candidatus Nitrosocosmicus sp.]
MTNLDLRKIFLSLFTNLLYNIQNKIDPTFRNNNRKGIDVRITTGFIIPVKKQIIGNISSL